ncbi:MAG TPA: hypothetical protein VGE55_13195 [Limnobacter sp.]|uniref:hypothetical protein n=1 Tax=Limnobacter sp. TaxID=2003368 RepID=UPI002EDA0965
MNTLNSPVGLGMSSGVSQQARPSSQDIHLFDRLISGHETYQRSVTPVATPELPPDTPLQLDLFNTGIQEANRLVNGLTSELKARTSKMKGSNQLDQLVNPGEVIDAVWSLASTSIAYSVVGEKGQRLSDDVATLVKRRS